MGKRIVVALDCPDSLDEAEFLTELDDFLSDWSEAELEDGEVTRIVNKDIPGPA